MQKMRVHKTLPITALLALLVVPGVAQAQLRRFPSSSSADQGVPRRASTGDADADASRMLLGMTLGTSGTDRDTLGLLVTQVLRDGPSDRAGIDEGNRLAEIDGVSLRLDPVDVGRQSAIDALMRRLTRTLRGLQGGEQATLRVFSAGKFKNANVQLGNAPSAPNAGPVVLALPTPTPAAAPPSVSVAVPGSPDAPGRATFTGAMQTLADVQSQLRRLADDEGSTALADSLLQAARDLGAIQRRLRAAQADQQRRRSSDDVSDRGSTRRGSTVSSDVPGLSLSPVSEDLSDYFGDGSERGLLVLQADAAWSPIRNGDVILSVDGAPVTPSRLRDARDARQPVRIELLRRRRQTTVTLNAREE
jgi:S1-C subfamily serine protease